MESLKVNEMYKLKLGQADPVQAIYLGIKQFNRKNKKHVFLVYTNAYRVTKKLRFYLGDLNKTSFEEGYVKIKEPKLRRVKNLEERFIEPLINKLKNQ